MRMMLDEDDGWLGWWVMRMMVDEDDGGQTDRQTDKHTNSTNINIDVSAQ